MIYRSNYFRKELRQGYTNNSIGTRRKLAFALFLGLISFASFFLLQTVRQSVLSDVIPEVMQPSYFSTIYIYIHVALALNALYFIIYYESLFFYEIKRNSWYLLAKMGYSPVVMIFSKLFALLLSIVFVYTVGFGFTIFLTVFLRYYPVLAYFPTLYLTGLIDLIIIGTFSMIISLFIKTVTNARYFILFSIVILTALKKVLGHYTILSNRVSMQFMYNLFDLSRTWFIPVAAGIVLLCIFVGIIRAQNISKYYNLPYDCYDGVLPADAKIMHIDTKTGRKKPVDNSERIARRNKALDVAFTSFLILFIVATLSFNLVILAINAPTYGRDFAVRGIIPYIFKSTSMEPAIMLNDLAYFKKLEDDDSINRGHIILFEEDNISYVERVFDISDGVFHVDIDNYPPMSQPEAMIKAVEREAIIGIYYDRNRWLGALILFANTVFGRLFFLLIPGILLFYYKPIMERLHRGEAR